MEKRNLEESSSDTAADHPKGSPSDELLDDQRQRWRGGEAVRVEAYLDRDPALSAETVLDLIYSEVELREERGEAPQIDEYERRFPQLARPIADYFTVHRALRADRSKTNLSSVNADADHQAAAPVLAPAHTTLPNIPGYRDLQELGRGGMGVVYRAFDESRQSVVALKTINLKRVAPLNSPWAIDLFKQEFRNLQDVVHPNLVCLYELISVADDWFITMELVEGVDFLLYVRGEPGALAEETTAFGEGPMPADPQPILVPTGPPLRPLSQSGLRRLRKALLQLAEGVAALHAAGKLHRDIKPSNVMVTRQGRVKLLDFGLAVELKRSEQHPNAEAKGPGGTIRYMSPEQAGDLPITPASDWYSVGVMLYEALTGRLPFFGTDFEIMWGKQERDPPPPGELVSRLPADLATLCVELLRRDPAARPVGRDVLRRLGSGEPPPEPASLVVLSPTQAAPLVGRERHLAALEAAFSAVRPGRAVILRVHGPSGVGKSTLIQRFLDDLVAGDRAVVLAGRCFQQESVPYKALDSVIDKLADYLARLPSAEVQTLLPRDVQPLGKVFPVLRRVRAIAEAPRRGAEMTDPQEQRRGAFTALRALFERLGDHLVELGRPLVLAIDDVQWGDCDSADLLTHILKPPDPPVLLLLQSYRSEDAATSPFVTEFIKGMEGSPRQAEPFLDHRELAVEALAPPEARDLALRLLGHDTPASESQADAVTRESGGNPLFIAELVRHLQAGAGLVGRATAAPELSLDDVLWARIRRLPEEARRMLEVVAVSGQPLRQSVLYQGVGGTTDGRSALALLRKDRLIRGRVASESDEIETYHDRVRETIVARLDPAVRRELHRRLALALEASGAADPELLGTHFRAAGEPEKAVDYLTRAAERAVQTLAFERGATLYRQALELRGAEGPEGRRLSSALGDALANAGRGAEAARAYLKAAEGGDRAESLERRRRAAMQYLISGHIDEGLTALRTVLHLVRMKEPVMNLRTQLGMLVRRVLLHLRGFGFRPHDPSEIAAADLIRIDVCWSAAVGLSVVDPLKGDYFQLRCLELALRAGERFRIARSLAMEGGHEAIFGVPARRFTARILSAAEAQARSVDEPYTWGYLALAQGIAAYLEGRWKDGLEGCDRADKIFRDGCTGVAWERDTAHAFALWALIRLGELAEVARRRPLLLAEARERGDRYAVMNLSTYLMSWVRLAADEPEEAQEEVMKAIANWSETGYNVQRNDQVAARVRIHLYAERGGHAWELIRQNWPLLRRSGLLHIQFVRVVMYEIHVLSALAAAADEPDPRPLLREAARDARRLEREAIPWSLGLARLSRAGLAAAGGDASGASAHMAAAIRRFEEAELALHVASARRRLGEFIGGDEGAAHIAAADSWMLGQKIRNPARYAALCAPDLQVLSRLARPQPLRS